MALTAQEFTQLQEHWPLVIQTIHPTIDDIPKGQGDTIADLLATWRGALPKPSVAEVEDVLLNTVLPLVQAEQQAEADAVTEKAEIRNAKAQTAIDTLTANIATLDGAPTNAEVIAIVRQNSVYLRALIRAARHIL